MKEVKRKIINGRMKGRGNNKGTKTHTHTHTHIHTHAVCRKSKWFSSYRLRTSTKSQGRGERFPVVIVNQRTADGP